MFKKFILCLQRFAEANVQTTLLNSSGNDLSPEMKTFYVKELIRLAGPKLVHAQFAVHKPLPKGNGKIVEWRRWTKLPKALKPLTEGVTPDGTALDVGYITKEVAQYGAYSALSDVLSMTAIDNTIAEATAEHADSAGLTLDTIVRNELAQGLNVIYAPKVSGGTATTVSHRYDLDSSAKLRPADVKRAATFLKKMNAPMIDGSYIAIIHPSVAADLTDAAEWIEAHKYSAASEIFNGEIGKLHGVRFIESTEAKIWKGADLTESARTVTVASYSSKVITIDEALTADEAAALIGRPIIVDGIYYEIASATSGTAGNAKITVKDATGITNVPADGDIIYPGEGAKEGKAAYGTVFFGKGAYGDVALAGEGNVEVIVKPLGAGDDPLNQRSTVGWKCTGYGAKVLIPEYLVRVESGSSYSDEDAAN